MRITNIEITNFQGLRHAALAVSEPVLLVSGNNGAGKSSLLDAIAMAFTGQPIRVSKKKDLAQLVTEDQKKGEAVVTWETEDGPESVGIALPSGKGAPLVDQPALPFVLDASRFAALDSKERRRMLFELTGSSASPNEVAKRLAERGADAHLIEKIKPMLRAGFDAAAAQAKDYAAESRGAWKHVTGEQYGSEKAEGWEPEAIAVTVTQDEIDAAAREVSTLNADLAEAQQTLGGQRALIADADQRAQRVEQLEELAGMIPRRQAKLDRDRTDLAEWQTKLTAAEAAARGDAGYEVVHALGRVGRDFEQIIGRSDGYTDGKLVTTWASSIEAERLADVMKRYRAEHGEPAKPVDTAKNPELAKRVPEFQQYVTKLANAVANSERDLRAAQDAATQLEALNSQSADAPSAEALANAEQVINQLRQDRDAKQARLSALQEAFTAASSRESAIQAATEHHERIKAWVVIAAALAPDGIPSDILKGALQPVNDLLKIQSSAVGWHQVAISDDIEVTYDGRLYGLLSESEKWRCDALLAIAIARLSGLGFVTLDRFDVLQPSVRPQILKLLISLTKGGDLDTAILAGTMKQPMATVPAGAKQVWIEGGVIDDQLASAA